MLSQPFPLRQHVCRFLLVLFALAGLWTVPVAPTIGQRPPMSVLRIGATGTLTGNADSAKEKAGMETLRSFIREETGLTNEIHREKNWRDLADKMGKGRLQVAVFQGHEFAWAQENHAELKPLVLAVNVYRYSAAHVLVRRDAAIKDFAGLRGRSLLLPITQEFVHLYVDRQSRAAGQKMEMFFAKISCPENVEDALDDIVDGKAQAVAVDGAALEAFKRRKPGRFNQLKEIARSQPFPPVVVATYGSVLDEATRQRFKGALLGAARKQKGETLLTLSHLTGFETVPDGFSKVLADTRKAYPPDELEK